MNGKDALFLARPNRMSADASDLEGTHFYPFSYETFVYDFLF